MEINVIHAEKRHKEFLVHSNSVINNVNDTTNTNMFAMNLDKDYYIDNPKFYCLVAECNGTPVGMILYSKFYWANDGEVLWISQMFVEEEYRSKGVFFKLINKLREENKDIKLVSCATGNENRTMHRILKFYDAHEINLKFYYKKV